MSYSNHPYITYLKYYVHKLLPRFFGFMTWPLLLGALAFKGWLVPHYARQVFDAPRSFVYRFAGDPDVEIPIQSPGSDQGGLTAMQRAILTETLDNLPQEHVRKVGMIGAIPHAAVTGLGSGVEAVYDEAGVIALNMTRLQDPIDFQRALLHEVGHAVQYHVLSSQENKTWIQLHRASSDPFDYVNQEAQDGDDAPAHSGDDFAETYAAWSTSSNDSLFAAIDAVTKRHTVVLQKILFAAALFANPDNTLNFYTVTATPSGSSEVVEKRPYVRTAKYITIGNYTFDLKGDVITTIEVGRGDQLASGLSIPVPPIVFERLKITGPGSSEVSDTVTDPGTSLTRGGIQLLSPRSPNEYIPIRSDAGFKALAGEQALTNNPSRTPTVEDQIHPHGEYDIISPGRN